MTNSDTRTCPSCGQLSPTSATWCEACGHELASEPKPECVTCGEPAVEDDGYCHSCGHRQPVPRDHVEIVDGPISAVSDRGQRHHHNEDAVAIAQVDDDTAVLVVCDGVSSTPGSAEISALAATAAAESLATAAADGIPPEHMAVSGDALKAAVEAAQLEAGAAAMASVIDESNPPSTTLVAAVARRTAGTVLVSVVWLGDSRVYWIDGVDVVEQLTVDHEIDGALTRWVGVDASDHSPQVAHYEFPLSPGADLIVCSDGMWRYFAPEVGGPARELVKRLKGHGRGLDLVRAMVDHANERGGHDNISVAHWAPGSSDGIMGTTVGPASQSTKAQSKKVM